MHSLYLLLENIAKHKQFDEFGGNLYLSLSKAGVREEPFSQLFDNKKDHALRCKRNFSNV